MANLTYDKEITALLVIDAPPPEGQRSGVAQLNKGGLTMMEKGLTLTQRVAICFAAGVIGGLAVVLFSHLLF
jgi:hypothetical protein